MKRVIAIAAAVAAGAALAQPVHAQRRARTGLLNPTQILFAGSHFDPANNPNAGTVVQGSGRVPRLGKVLVTVSSSWDWSAFSADHPCALMNKTAKTLNDNLGGTGQFTADATITFVKLHRGTPDPSSTLTANIIGGSVCELQTLQPPCPTGDPGPTISEGIAAFEIDGSSGSGAFAGITGGSGLIRTRFDSCQGTFLVDDIMLRVEK